MSESRPVFPIYALLIAALAGGGTLLMEQPFRSTRPAEQTDINLGVTGTYDVPARLWQDPLSASLIEFRRREKEGINSCNQVSLDLGDDASGTEPTLEDCLLEKSAQPALEGDEDWRKEYELD